VAVFSSNILGIVHRHCLLICQKDIEHSLLILADKEADSNVPCRRSIETQLHYGDRPERPADTLRKKAPAPAKRDKRRALRVVREEVGEGAGSGDESGDDRGLGCTGDRNGNKILPTLDSLCGAPLAATVEGVRGA